MKAKAKESESKQMTQHCFRLFVDGKLVGTFLDRERKSFASLAQMKGVELRSCWLYNGWTRKPSKTIREIKDKTSPLLDGIGFIPVARRGKRGFNE